MRTDVRTDPPAEDVEHACPSSKTLGTVHDMEYRESQAESGQSVLDY